MDDRDAVLLQHYVPDGRGADSRDLRRAPGPNELAERQREAQAFTNELLSLYEKGLKLAEKTFTRYATTKGRTEAKLEEAFRAALTETIVKEATMLAGRSPYGKALMTVLELSNAFAAGAGAAILAAQEKARRGSSVPRSLEGEVAYERRYLVRAVGELEGVLRRGLAEMAEVAINILFREAQDALKRTVADLASQIAEQLPKHCDLFAILNADVKEVSGKIPPGRAGVERISFGFVSRLFLREYGSDKLAKTLDPVLGGITSKKQIDIGLMSGLIQVLADGSYTTYKAFVPVDKAIDELKAVLIEQARSLLLRTKDVVTIEPGDALKIEDERITIPAALYDEITREPGPLSPADYARLVQREAEYLALRARLAKDLVDLGRVYQRAIDRVPAAVQEDQAIRLNNRLADHRQHGVLTLRLAENQIVKEFGENVPTYGPVRTRLTAGGGPHGFDLLPLPELTPLPLRR
jgi:hypothetical protein